MHCPRCGGESRVYETREAGALRFRLRACQKCGHRFRTCEEYLRPVTPRKPKREPEQGELFNEES
jgi:transcriptional regulator NrdR family protein